MKITEDQKNELQSMTDIEIINYYCENTLKTMEDEIGMPINIHVHRTNTTKDHQDLKTSLLISNIVGKLKVIGKHYSIKNNSSHIQDLDYGLKLFLLSLIDSYKNNYISDNQYTDTKQLINDYILDENIENIKNFFLIGKDQIAQYKMIFLLYEFAYRSPVHQGQYNFKGEDIRRSTFGRIELSTMNKYQDYKLNIDNIENQLIDGISNFLYNITDIIDIIFVQKEVQYRTSILNEIYFNFEHFLSVIIKTFKMNDENLGKKKIRNKQGYLVRVFDELGIKHSIDYSIVFKEIETRCVESSSKYLKLMEKRDKQTINLIDIFLKIIDMRNSLHSNGASNKDIDAFNIGDIHYDEVKKNQQFTTMAMHQLIPLLIISVYSMELIVKKLSNLEKINGVTVPKVIIDEYVKHIKEL